MSSGNCPEPSGFGDAYNDGFRYFCIVLYVLGIVFLVTPLIMWRLERKGTPYLKQRSLLLVALTAIGTAMQLTTTALMVFVERENFPCALLLWLTYLILPFTVAPLGIRMIILKNRQRFGSLLFSQVGSNDIEGDFANKGSFMMRLRVFLRIMCTRRESDEEIAPSAGGPNEGSRRKLETDRLRATYFAQTSLYAMLVFGLIFLLSLAVMLFVYSSEEGAYFDPRRKCFNCVLDNSAFWPYVVLAAFLTAAFIISALALRGLPDDALEIKWEMFWVALFFGPLFLLTFGIGTIDPGDLRADSKFESYLFLTAGFFLLHGLQGWRPVLKARQIKKRRLRRTSSMASEGIAGLLSGDGATKQAFMQFLQNSFALESGLFIQAVDRFKNAYASSSDRENAIRASDIFYSYIASDSMLEINISYMARKRLVDKLGPVIRFSSATARASAPAVAGVPVDIFDQCQKEVQALIEADLLSRWPESKPCQDLATSTK